MARERRRWPWLAALAVGGGVAWVALAMADAKRIELEAELERVKLEAAGAITAQEESARMVAKQGENLLKLTGLDKEVNRLKRELKIKPKVIETIKWKTRPAEVEVEDVIDWDALIEDTEESGFDWDCCDIEAIKAALPKPVFYGSGAVAKLQTKKGNTFVLGKVFVIRQVGLVDNEENGELDDVLLADLDWEADATEYLTVARAPRYKRLGWYAGVGWRPNIETAYFQGEGFSSEDKYGVELGVSLRPRWRWLKGVQGLFGWDTLAEAAELKIVLHGRARGAG